MQRRPIVHKYREGKVKSTLQASVIIYLYIKTVIASEGVKRK